MGGISKEIKKEDARVNEETGTEQRIEETVEQSMEEAAQKGEQAAAPIQDAALAVQEETGSMQQEAARQEDAQGAQEEAPGEGQAVDEVNQNILAMVQETRSGAGMKKKGENGEGDKYFDKLPVDRGGYKSVSVQDKDASELKEKVGERREGSLYQAVLVSKLLKENKSNPMASGIFSRAVNSSKWATVADINAGVTGFNGLLSTFDKNAKSQSVYKAVGLVTNFVTLISSIRNFYTKLRKLQFKKSGQAWFENAFLGIGMLGDFALAFAKAVAIAKTISSYAHVNLPILNKVSNWMFLASGTSQAISLLNVSRGLAKGWKGINLLEMRKAQLWPKAKEAVHEILGKRGQPSQEGEALAEEASEGTDSLEEVMEGAGSTEEAPGDKADGLEEPEGSQGKEEEDQEGRAKQGEGEGQKAAPDPKAAAKAKAAQKKKDAQKADARLAKAQRALEALQKHPEDGTGDSNTEKRKDDLIAYIGLSKRIKKQKHDEAEMAASAVNCAVGLCTSIISGGKFVTSQGAARTRSDGWGKASQAVGGASLVMGAAANLTTMGSSTVRLGSRLTNGADDRSEAVKERLYEKIETLGKNEYGLKFLEEALANEFNLPPSDNPAITKEDDEIKSDLKRKANAALQLYAGTDGMMQMMGVPQGQLVKARKLEDFKNILASGLV